MARSKDQQCKEVVEGLGLGLVKLGFNAVPKDKFTFEMALNHSWHQWRFTDHFPSVDGARDPANEVWLCVPKSANRRFRSVEWHEEEGHRGEFLIRFTQRDWTPEEVCEHVGDLRIEAWLDLAKRFKDEFVQIASRS